MMHVKDTEVNIYKIKELKKKHALDQENNPEKKKAFRFNNINQFYFQPLV